MEKGSDTRSGLLWEVERLLDECTELPQVLLMENVPQVHGKKHKQHFDKWIEFLESKGYSNHWQDLDAKDYGVPHNRKRCFMVSILGDYSFEFPKPIPLQLKFIDMLDSVVDEKFYLSDKQINAIENSTFNTARGRIQKKDYCDTLCARDWKDPKCVIEPIRLGGIYDTENSRHQAGSIWDKNSIAPTINTMQGGNSQPLVIDEPSPHRFYKQAFETLNENECKTGDIIDAFNKRVNKSGISPTITTCPDGFKTAILTAVDPTDNAQYRGRVRKITPKECWRLMGFDDSDYEKAEKVCSNTQLYKQAGNSIVVDVLMAIFKELFAVKEQACSQWLTELLGGVG